MKWLSRAILCKHYLIIIVTIAECDSNNVYTTHTPSSSFKPDINFNKKVEDDKVVLVQMTDVGHDDGYN